MSRNGTSDLKNELKRFADGLGSYALRVADPKEGFERAMHGCHPRDFWKRCNSVVVFALYVGPDYYRLLKLTKQIVGEDRIMHIVRDWIECKIAEFIK